MKGVIAREPGTEVIFTDITEPAPGEYDTLVRHKEAVKVVLTV